MLVPSAGASGALLRASCQPRRLSLALHPQQNLLSLFRHYSSQTAPNDVANALKRSTLALPSTARFNEIGVQQLSSHVHSQIFPRPPTPPEPELVALSKDHLTRHELLGKAQDAANPIAFDLPRLQGETLDEHFYKLGMDASAPYLDFARRYSLIHLSPAPRKWVRRSGWTKYNADGTTEQVHAPNESMLTFDTEVMWKESPFAVMACAASPTAWYAWLSPWLLGESENPQHLVPLGDPSNSRIVVGHNIGYDRARILEEYDLQQSRNFFLDTMSLHVAVNGMCSQQRPTWMRHKKNRDLREKIAQQTDSYELGQLLENKALSEEEEELWVGRSSINSLRDVAKFHCNVTIDKAQRDHFGELDRDGIQQRLDELLDYCAADVSITHRVYRKVFPNFLETCPHPVSFGALRHLSTVILPVNETWAQYIKRAEETYHRRLSDVQNRLEELCQEAVEVRDKPEVYNNDPWLRQLDWSGQEIKMVKGKKKGDPPRPAARQKKPGMPKWYKDLFPKSNGPMNLTVRTRIAPILLKLAWDGYPLVWSDKYGWTFQVPKADVHKYQHQAVVQCDMSEEKNEVLKIDTANVYYKLPHKDGPEARCVSPMAKGYLQYFEGGKLSSQFALAKEALEMNASCSYWISARDRIMTQLVVYEKDLPGSSRDGKSQNPASNLGFILPQIIPMGTITRRAVENTWLTASNAKANRVGSELKAMVKAPPGYVFVGADVDSEELWIASLVGDSQFQIHGGNAIGFMTLEGTKAAGTDLHSKTAKILGISRNNAKVFNYGRIYGAGLKFAATLLRQFNPSISDDQTKVIAANLYKETKGTRTIRKTISDSPFWRGGTESFVFNKLEEFAEQERPRTPVLGAGITEALMRRFINKGSFMTSRINWAIQSSGVDYLHLLIISMDFLVRRFNLNARLAISVHDEIRYLVKEEDKYRAAMALQVANIWTRAMFSQQMGIDDLPQSCAYFSAVDIDHVLRKEVDMDCVTPSHPQKIPPGECIDIAQLLEKGDQAFLDPSIEPCLPPAPEKYTYTPRKTVMSSLDCAQDISFIKAQIVSDDKELRAIIRDIMKSQPSSDKSNATSGSSASRRRSVSKVPSHAEPQRAVLMEVEPNLLDGFKGFNSVEKTPQFPIHRYGWKPKTSPRL
ncbi:DNA polymerase gamma, putative [Coccidioides posadasii C735 delta SOWgp]|uniref:DNA-directed DNA polymerase n=2 Tax=Coccidioides posadasii TaxID=199306 RepID=A0A0J6FS95_COCPO|nr:DNA polymerase gamma, putative [Coccidioides posadasii C735 delta SOWgp]EER25097.1 DNA polymerase gamma, putative [Coccidioides posadasii C735 delta SOWgp]KMM71934.1 DNA polymerase gamma [Coccidioides posadasii RMSCC 3488]|eukprot:XP_003067242.1 DNA polymerase gamma, putative [Coccidioides posadasii C735 delta SOWgp]